MFEGHSLGTSSNSRENGAASPTHVNAAQPHWPRSLSSLMKMEPGWPTLGLVPAMGKPWRDNFCKAGIAGQYNGSLVCSQDMGLGKT